MRWAVKGVYGETVAELVDRHGSELLELPK